MLAHYLMFTAIRPFLFIPIYLLQDLHREILDAIPEEPSQHAPLVFKKKKPIPLKLLTPKIVQM